MPTLSMGCLNGDCMGCPDSRPEAESHCECSCHTKRENMTAHMERITNRCQAPNCPRHKYYRVFNEWNLFMGDFCETHARAEVEKLQQEEKESKDAT